MYHAEIYQRVRRACHVEGMSTRQAAKLFGLHLKTVSKILSFPIPPGYQRSKSIHSPKLGLSTLAVATLGRPSPESSPNRSSSTLSMVSARPSRDSTSAKSDFSCSESFSQVRLRPKASLAATLIQSRATTPTLTIPACLHMSKTWRNNGLIFSSCLRRNVARVRKATQMLAAKL